MDDEYMEEDGNQQNTQQQQEEERPMPAPSSMDTLERRKREQARQFSSGLLANLMPGTSGTNENGGEGSSNGVRIKQELPGDDEDAALVPIDKRVKEFLSLETENCTNEVFHPIDQEIIPLRTIPFESKVFEFRLDTFQSEANKCLENDRSVVVCAHTSAGKTVIALYAIALALKGKKNAVYTTPIKALSNQKYKELREEFFDVGLMTGDVTINETASCLVMTTEILRNKLYHDPEFVDDLGWVIFDEVHYMQDKERGVVWEESIILLPEHIRLLFLSAAIPNAKEFAKWISYVRREPCHLIRTRKRPVPLHQFIFPSGSDGLYQIVDNNDRFRPENYDKAMNFLIQHQPANTTMTHINQNRRSIGINEEANKKDVLKVIRTIHERKYLPCLVFSFSRKECEMYAAEVKQMDFNDEEEKSSVRSLFQNAIDLLPDEDKSLPQIRVMLLYLLRGIGIHHSGIVPIIREVIELFFAEGLVKVLFATETFAMGVNMPAKSVLFTSARKFDGTTNRWMTNGEYIQMSGRAGRRGRDEKGMVVTMLDQPMEPAEMQRMMTGLGDPLKSQFRLNFNMLLNQIKTQSIPETMVEKSFLQWQAIAALPSLYRAMMNKKSELDACQFENEPELDGLHESEKNIQELDKSIRKRILIPGKVVPFFQPGRLLKMKHFDKDYDWGVLVDWQHIKNPLKENSTDCEMIYIVYVAILISSESERCLPNLAMVRPPGPRDKGVIAVIPFGFECINAISTCRLKIPMELKSKEAREHVATCISKTKERYKDEIPDLDPIMHMNVTDHQVKRDCQRLEHLKEDLREHPLREQRNFEEVYEEYMKKQKIKTEYEEAEKRYRDSNKLLLTDELECRNKALETLGYITTTGDKRILLEKGKALCELTSANGLVLGEMIYAIGAFVDMGPEEIAAILSCFVFNERAFAVKLPPKLAELFKTVQEFIRKTATILKKYGLDIDQDEYLKEFSPGMMVAVYEWCKGASFGQILKNTQIFEGSVVRCLRRLDELLREMIAAAETADEEGLKTKLVRAQNSLKRGLPFASSLYI